MWKKSAYVCIGLVPDSRLGFSHFSIDLQRFYPVNTGPVGHDVVHGDFLVVGRVLEIFQNAHERLVQITLHDRIFVISRHTIVVEDAVQKVVYLPRKQDDQKKKKKTIKVNRQLNVL